MIVNQITNGLVLFLVLALASIVHTQNTNLCTGHPHLALVRNVKDCASYYQCYNGNPIIYRCSALELFDNLSHTCEPADKVDCFECPADEFFIDVPVVNECQQFVRCFNNESQQLTCAEGLLFDRNMQQCNLAADVTCPFDVLCPQRNDRLTFIRDRDNCAKYYLCINGVAQNLTCPPTLVFNTVTNQCDLPDNVECSSGKDYLNENPVKETFPCPDRGGPLFPHATDCQKFFTCSPENMALTHTCPGNMYFDHVYMFCGQRSEVTCKSGAN